ncbi:recombinase family protein [Parafrankia elaeagni]|uniref:recombinase family protein n=1 Tax=Parafrankia elaeagni TaxID=222534 RepID=UPI000A01C41B|nr:recombinase family protein [Parafrankia elaeagni]
MERELSDGTVEGIAIDPETGEERPFLRRPGRRTRAVVYPPFKSYGVEVRPGTKPIWLYLRLSKYHRDGADAIERHRIDLTRLLAIQGGWTIMGEYVDNDSASAAAVRTRKGWHALNADVEAGTVTAVAFWKLDRTNRIATRCMEWIARCQIKGVMLVSHQDSADELNTATAGAKLVVGIKAILAEVETDVMSERQLNAKRHAAEAGFHHGGTRPFGWMAGARETDELGRSGVRLVPHPVEFEALKAAVPLVISGKSLRSVARYWKDQFGITTADGSLMAEANIRRMLTSPRMVGYRMRQVPEHQRGVKINLFDYVARDAEGNPVIAQQPVCDLAVWRQVVSKLEAARNSQTRSPWGSFEWLLTGLTYCECGHRLYGLQKAYKGEGGVIRRRYAYRCTANRRKGAGTCTYRSVLHAEPGEAHVQGWLFAYLTDDRLAQARAKEDAARQLASPTGSLMRDLEAARAEREILVAQQGSPAYRGPKVGILLGMIDNVQERIDKLEAQANAATVDTLPVTSHADLIAQWPDMDLSQRRQLLARVIERIDVTAGKEPLAERVKIAPRL